MMSTKNFIKNSNEWRGNYALELYQLVYKYPWTLAFLILVVAVAIGIYRVEQIYGQYIDDRVNVLIDQRIQELTSPK